MNDNNNMRQAINQVIVSRTDDKFLICKRFPRSIAVVSPFEKIEDTFLSNFQTTNHRAIRVHVLYSMIPKISRYSVSEQGVTFDCLQSIGESTDIFKSVKNGVESGFIHFDLSSFKKKDEKTNKFTTYIDINPRLIFAKLEDQEMINIELKELVHEFKTTKFKVFSVVLERGFILCTVNKTLTTLYLTITKPSQNFIGNIIRKEMNKINSNISPLWPIFNFDTDQNKLWVSVKDKISKDYNHVNNPILIKMEREIGSNEVVASCIGYGIKLD